MARALPKFKVWAKKSPFRADILDDRVAVITGGGSGIGFEVARQLGKHGAKLCLMGPSTARVWNCPP